ncbi:hypothetical protein [Brevundimonas sp. GCM10030266]|uniref:hypothetical protein n=1 Tax=Brevundimonas sp. GCM10030266 TaxID=3273386 RepID=UPI0036183511
MIILRSLAIANNLQVCANPDGWQAARWKKRRTVAVASSARPDSPAVMAGRMAFPEQDQTHA